MEPEKEYGESDWLNEQLEEEWALLMDNLEYEEMHEGENPDELGDI